MKSNNGKVHKSLHTKNVCPYKGFLMLLKHDSKVSKDGYKSYFLCKTEKRKNVYVLYYRSKYHFTLPSVHTKQLFLQFIQNKQKYIYLQTSEYALTSPQHPPQFI